MNGDNKYWSSYKLNFLFIFLTLSQGQVDYVPGESYFGRNNYIQYIAGNSPVILSAPHGGRLTPDEIPDRTGDVTTILDTHTEKLAAVFAQEMYNITGVYPHVIITHLRRTKIDCNREIIEAAQENQWAELAWNEFHNYIEGAKSDVEDRYGQGLYIDLHAHGHQIRRLELGYRLSKTQLALSDDLIEPLNDQSSINTLSETSQESFADLLRGPNSFGALMENRGIPSVPSPQNPDPGEDPYFRGGYNTARHGSLNGGVISGFQIESHGTGFRNTEGERTASAIALTESIQEYLNIHFGLTINGEEITNIIFRIRKNQVKLSISNSYDQHQYFLINGTIFNHGHSWFSYKGHRIIQLDK